VGTSFTCELVSAASRLGLESFFGWMKALVVGLVGWFGRWRCSLRILHRDEGERDLGRSSPEYRERKAQSAAAATSHRSRTVHPNPALTQAIQKPVRTSSRRIPSRAAYCRSSLSRTRRLLVLLLFLFKHALLLLFGWGAALWQRSSRRTLRLPTPRYQQQSAEPPIPKPGAAGSSQTQP
jgi:hypothetical protein